MGTITFPLPRCLTITASNKVITSWNIWETNNRSSASLKNTQLVIRGMPYWRLHVIWATMTSGRSCYLDWAVNWTSKVTRSPESHRRPNNVHTLNGWVPFARRIPPNAPLSLSISRVVLLNSLDDSRRSWVALDAACWNTTLVTRRHRRCFSGKR